MTLILALIWHQYDYLMGSEKKSASFSLGFMLTLVADSRIYMVAEPLEKGLGEDIEKGKAPRWVRWSEKGAPQNPVIHHHRYPAW